MTVENALCVLKGIFTHEFNINPNKLARTLSGFSEKLTTQFPTIKYYAASPNISLIEFIPVV